MSTRPTPVRNSHRRSFTATRRLVADVAFGGTALMSLLLLPNCNFPIDVAETQVATEAREGDTTDSDTGPKDSSSLVGDTRAESDTSSTMQGGTLTVVATTNGPDAEATSEIHRIDCFDASNSGQFRVSLNSTFGIQFEKDCGDAAGSARLDIDMSATGQDGTVHSLLDAAASIGCADEQVTVDDLPAFSALIPGTRYHADVSRSFQDVFPYGVGDQIRVELVIVATAGLPAQADESASIELKAGLFYSNSTFGLAKVPCGDPCNCETNGECTSPEVCVECVCREPAVASDPLDLQVSTDDVTIDPGATFSVSVDASVHAGDFIPYIFDISVDSDALDVNGPLVPGTGVGSCNGVPLFVGGGSSLVRGVAEATLFFDVNGNGIADDGDPVVVVTDEPSGDFEATVTLPEDPVSIVIPMEGVVDCDLLSLFNGGSDGTYDVTTQIIGYDPDTRGADDQAGTDPPMRTLVHELVIGDGGPGEECANPVGAPGTSASDAQYILRAAVGQVECALCVCDAAGGGSIVASDALLALRLAVGQQVVLACPPCA